MAIQPIKRQNVSEMVFDQMREMIATGEWKPGCKISSENELAAQMGVSRVTIRSAIQKLSSLGLVESRHGDGTYVCQLDGTQAFNTILPMMMLTTQNRESLHEFRTIIECACARLAAARITDEQLETLRRCNQEMTEHQDEPNVAAASDMAFHKCIADATGNPYILQVFEIIESIFTKSMVENIHTMGASSGVKFHAEIWDALKQHDPVLAEQRMLDHLDTTHRTMQQLLENK